MCVSICGDMESRLKVTAPLKPTRRPSVAPSATAATAATAWTPLGKSNVDRPTESATDGPDPRSSRPSWNPVISCEIVIVYADGTEVPFDPRLI
jgi:hypothetical protein